MKKESLVISIHPPCFENKSRSNLALGIPPTIENLPVTRRKVPDF